jgi:hypothetical protein
MTKKISTGNVRIHKQWQIPVKRGHTRPWMCFFHFENKGPRHVFKYITMSTTVTHQYGTVSQSPRQFSKRRTKFKYMLESRCGAKGAM